MSNSLMRRYSFGATEPFPTRMWDWFTTPMGYTPMSKLFGEVNSYVPPVDIYETRNEVIVAASLPGLDASKTNIEVVQDSLTLSGEQHPVLCFEPEEGATRHLNGIPRFGRFSFNFQLPAEVDASQSQAKYENGVLCIRFLKAQSARPVRIAISNDGNQPVVTTASAPRQEQITDGSQS
jgi:HSP20 family protein